MAGGLLRISARRMRGAEQQQRHRMVVDNPQDFARLLPGQRRIGGQQAAGVRQRLLQRPVGSDARVIDRLCCRGVESMVPAVFQPFR